MWHILSDKIPMGSNLPNRSQIGPNRCILCDDAAEDTVHLFLNCPAIHDIWRLIITSLNLQICWESPSVSTACETWWLSTNPHKLRNLPILFCWGIWIARNRAIFHNPPLNWTSSVAHIISIYHMIPDDPPPPPPPP